MKVWLQTDGAGQVGTLQRRLDTQAAELASTKTAQVVKDVALREKFCQYVRLELELSAAQAAINRREGIMRAFAERVCTGYTWLARA